MSDDEVWVKFASSCMGAALPMIGPREGEPSDTVIASACAAAADAMLSEYKKRFQRAQKPIRPLPQRNPQVD